MTTTLGIFAVILLITLGITYWAASRKRQAGSVDRARGCSIHWHPRHRSRYSCARRQCRCAGHLGDLHRSQREFPCAGPFPLLASFQHGWCGRWNGSRPRVIRGAGDDRTCDPRCRCAMAARQSNHRVNAAGLPWWSVGYTDSRARLRQRKAIRCIPFPGSYRRQAEMSYRETNHRA